MTKAGWQWFLPLSTLLFPGESNATVDGWKRGTQLVTVMFGGFPCFVLYQISVIQRSNGARDGEDFILCGKTHWSYQIMCEGSWEHI